MSNFEQIMKELDAPDYPATCDRCGYEGTNAEMKTHQCDPERDDALARLRRDQGTRVQFARRYRRR